jgi:hypothetical protein
MLLLQAMEQLGKTALAVGEEIVHRHLQTLLSGLQLAQQLLLIAADDLAAAEGVGARRSATKSAIVTSVSWPTALTIGIWLAKIARATRSSLKLHRSSSEPPPRPTISTSHSWRALASAMARTICPAHRHPGPRSGR